MPKRYISESCRSSESLAELSDQAERLYWRLVTVADDFGRFRAHTEIVQADCYKLEKNRPSVKAIEACLLMIAEADMLLLYEGPDGKRYGQFGNGWKEQGPPRANRSN